MPASVSYHRVAVTRGKELPTRLGLAAVMAGGAWAVTQSLWVFAWMAAVAASQLLDHRLTAHMRADPAYRPTPRGEAAYLGLIALNVAIYEGVTPLCWFTGGLEGKLFAVLVPTAGLLNIALQGQSAPRVVWAGCIPHALVLVGLPLATIALGQAQSPAGMAFVALGAALYVMHLAVAVKRNLRASAELAAAVNFAEQASAAKSSFLATMSHEIRTPLNGVLGMTEAMARDRLPKVQRQRLEVVRQSGEVLLVLLNDLLDISKIEAAKLELSDGVVNFEALAGQAEAAFAPLAANKGLMLRIETTPAVAGAWRADPTRVRQIFYNLLSNAVKFTDSGWVSAGVDFCDGRVVLRVSDTGPGVAPDQLPGLFERFVQADTASTRRHGGSGLGLAISRELARLMGGDIRAESTVGRGSTFSATLPLERADAVPVEDATPAPAAAREGLKVLVAEDNETNRLVLTTLLGQVGVVPHMTFDGAEALEAWRREDWDLVLMDIQMPVMDGLTATRRLRQIETETRRPRTPVLALTANAMAHHVAEYGAAGFDGVAAKPIQFNQLLAEIDAAIARAEARRAAA